MKEDILKLRKEGKSYSEIKSILGCSKSTISYHCADGQKEKSKLRQQKTKKSNKYKILSLRKKGFSLRKIAKILNLSKSIVTYYCYPKSKENCRKRQVKYRKNNIMIEKLRVYKGRKLKDATRDFQRRDDNNKMSPNLKEKYFNHKDVVEKFGIETFCYLSGERINLINDTNYSFDHKDPCSLGGLNTLDNLGVTITQVNKMKSDLSIDEFLEWCVKILKHNGYKVEK